MLRLRGICLEALEKLQMNTQIHQWSHILLFHLQQVMSMTPLLVDIFHMMFIFLYIHIFDLRIYIYVIYIYISICIYTP